MSTQKKDIKIPEDLLNNIELGKIYFAKLDTHGEPEKQQFYIKKGIRKFETFSDEDFLSITNDLQQLTYHLSVELRNCFRETVHKTSNKLFLPRKKLKQFLLFMLEVNDINHSLHEIIIKLDNGTITPFHIEQLGQLVEKLFSLCNQPKKNPICQNILEYLNFPNFTDDTCSSCFWSKKILSTISIVETYETKDN